MMATDAADDKNRQKWARIITKGIENVIRDQPEAFLRRARRGIPSEYRYVTSFACNVNCVCLDGTCGRPACSVIRG